MTDQDQNIELKSIEDLIPDRVNANRGTIRGEAALEHSLRRLGAGRSVLLDRRGRLIAGNKTVEKAAELGIDEVIVIKTDGTRLVAVQRVDMDLEQGGAAQEMAIADNRVGQLDLSWSPEMMAELIRAYPDAADGLFTPEELDAIIHPAPAEQPDLEEMFDGFDTMNPEQTGERNSMTSTFVFRGEQADIIRQALQQHGREGVQALLMTLFHAPEVRI